MSESQYVLLGMPDMNGSLRGKALSTDAFDSAVKEGTVMTDLLLGLDPVDTPIATYEDFGIRSGAGDLVVRPEIETLHPLTWRPGWQVCLATPSWRDGSPCELASREVLHGVLSAAAELGYDARAAFEYEVRIWDGDGQWYALLVDQGILPPPWRNHAALLRGLGVDLSAVRHTMEESFGAEAVERATRQALRTTGWSPLCGKAHVFKQALYLAHQRRHTLGHTHTGPGHILVGVLDDAEHPLDKPRCFRNPWNRRRRANLGLPDRGPSPVRLIVQARGTTLTELRRAVVAQLNATSWTR